MFEEMELEPVLVGGEQEVILGKEKKVAFLRKFDQVSDTELQLSPFDSLRLQEVEVIARKTDLEEPEQAGDIGLIPEGVLGEVIERDYCLSGEEEVSLEVILSSLNSEYIFVFLQAFLSITHQVHLALFYQKSFEKIQVQQGRMDVGQGLDVEGLYFFGLALNLTVERRSFESSRSKSVLRFLGN